MQYCPTYRMISSPNPISSIPTPSHHPSKTRLPPRTPALFPNPLPLPLLLPAHISKNLTVWSQQAMIKLPSSSVRLAHGSPSPRKSLRKLSRGRAQELCRGLPVGAIVAALSGLGASLRRSRPPTVSPVFALARPRSASLCRTASQAAKPSESP